MRPRIWVGYFCLALGAGLVAFWLWAAVDVMAFRTAWAKRLEQGLPGRSRPLTAEARVSREQAAGSGLIGRIVIPRLGLSELVLEGTSGKALRRGVGHVRNTAFPGEEGNVGLAGHRDSHFRRLREITKGDLIRLDTPDGVFTYQVAAIQIVNPDRGDLLAQTGSARLTLVTCYPFYWVGPAPRRFVVVAQPVATAPTGRA